MFVWTFARIVALSSLVACPLEASIAETIEYNGLPCNTWCQRWMGVSPGREAWTAEQEPALDNPTNDAHRSPRIKKPHAHASKQANDRLGKGSHRHLGSPLVSPPAATVLAPKPQVLPTEPVAVASTPTNPVESQAPQAALVAGSANVSKESKTDNTSAIGALPPPAPPEAPDPTASDPQPVAKRGADATAISSQTTPSEAKATAPSTNIALPKGSQDVASPLLAPQPQASDAQTAQSALAAPTVAPIREQSAAAPVHDSGPEVAAISPSGGFDSSAVHSVLILLTGPEVKLLSDLGNDPIIVAGSFPVSDAAIEGALSLATSKSVKIVDGSKQDIDRVFSGEIGAAVVDVISLAQEKDFPKFTGLNVFFIPVPAR